jgi:hypothetical protein
MKIEVSNGEIIDKLSILEIKKIKITDINKLTNINYEHNYLLQYVYKIIEQNPQTNSLYKELKKINMQLWDVEDQIRIKEKNQAFDKQFIDLARSVYKLNDHRAYLKKQINILTNSGFIEEKSYEYYK